jgi:uncharacterized membrane protein
MSKGRMEAFSDGVIAIIITIMVLELRPPEGADLAALRPLIPTLLGYVLSFIFIGIYWNNHHHLLQATKQVTGTILWANLHLLFWLSLIPFATAWMDEYPFTAWPAAIYGICLQMAGFAYYILARTLVAAHGSDSKLAAAIGNDRKGQLSLVFYSLAILFAFISVPVAYALYVVVAIMWLIPDRRIEKVLAG